jgi:hypothetical protein
MASEGSGKASVGEDIRDESIFQPMAVQEPCHADLNLTASDTPGGGGGARSKAAQCVPVTPIGGFASGCTDRFTIQRRGLNKRSLLVRTGVGG